MIIALSIVPDVLADVRPAAVGVRPVDGARPEEGHPAKHPVPRGLRRDAGDWSVPVRDAVGGERTAHRRGRLEDGQDRVHQVRALPRWDPRCGGERELS